MLLQPSALETHLVRLFLPELSDAVAEKHSIMLEAFTYKEGSLCVPRRVVRSPVRRAEPHAPPHPPLRAPLHLPSDHEDHEVDTEILSLQHSNAGVTNTGSPESPEGLSLTPPPSPPGPSFARGSLSGLTPHRE